MLSPPTPASSDPRADLLALSAAELSAAVAELGEKPFRARQLNAWLHKRYAVSLDEMTDLPKALREQLALRFALKPPAIELVQQSSDGTRKY